MKKKMAIVVMVFLAIASTTVFAEVPPPLYVSGYSDNSSIYLSWDPGSDPQIDHTEVWDNGVIILGITGSPIQINNLVNGVSHFIEVKNVDAGGNTASTLCSPYPLTPACTGAPPMTLLLLKKDGYDVVGYWIPQTAEVPCGTGVKPVSKYEVYRSEIPDMGIGGTIINSGHSLTQFRDPGALNDTLLYFYRVITTKGGVSEPTP